MSDLVLNSGPSSTTIAELTSQGIPFKTTMNLDLPQLPSDLTDLDDEDLMALFSKLTAYSNFLASQYACAVIDEREAEKKLEYVENLALLRESNLKSAKDTVTVLKAKVSTSPEVMELSDELAVRYNYRKLIEVMVNNVDRDSNLISRELTRRTSGGSFRQRGQRMFT